MDFGMQKELQTFFEDFISQLARCRRKHTRNASRWRVAPPSYCRAVPKIPNGFPQWLSNESPGEPKPSWPSTALHRS